jgi:hypothetical protein
MDLHWQLQRESRIYVQSKNCNLQSRVWTTLPTISYIQYLPKVFGSPRGPYAKTLFCSPLSTTVFNQIFSNFVCAYVEVVKTPLIFFRFLFLFSEVLFVRSKSLWKAESTLCKLGHFGLFFAVERLGLGKRDFF